MQIDITSNELKTVIPTLVNDNTKVESTLQNKWQNGYITVVTIVVTLHHFCGKSKSIVKKLIGKFNYSSNKQKEFARNNKSITVDYNAQKGSVRLKY